MILLNPVFFVNISSYSRLEGSAYWGVVGLILFYITRAWIRMEVGKKTNGGNRLECKPGFPHCCPALHRDHIWQQHSTWRERQVSRGETRLTVEQETSKQKKKSRRETKRPRQRKEKWKECRQIDKQIDKQRGADLWTQRRHHLLRFNVRLLKDQCFIFEGKALGTFIDLVCRLPRCTWAVCGHWGRNVKYALENK